jgi:hypothetical protein
MPSLVPVSFFACQSEDAFYEVAVAIMRAFESLAMTVVFPQLLNVLFR